MNAVARLLEGVRFLWRIRVRRWWARWPHLPRPSLIYLRWRLDTAYGAWGAPWRVVCCDAWRFLGWSREMGRLKRGTCKWL